MKKNTLENINISNEQIIITPKKLKDEFPLNENDQCFIKHSRDIITNIIHHDSNRLLIICGPCSIHDINSAIEYAFLLKELSEELKEKLYIVMRVYFEKPRTTIGWKGLINDPYMDGTNNLEYGLKIARDLLVKLIKTKLPLATETLDIHNPQYLGDLFSWSAIGARTTESQIHRELASGLPMPIGFKNSTDGNLETAVNAIYASSMSHSFIGINQSGKVSLFKTKGNKNTHIILRGGKKPNYYPEDIINCENYMKSIGLETSIMVDCSHGNSNKNYLKQSDVLESIIKQIQNGNNSIIGLMLESNIYSGNQPSKLPLQNMKYGVSITDACIDWKNTKNLLYSLYEKLK